MTAGFLDEHGNFIAVVNGRRLGGCPLCGKAPYLAEDEHNSYRLYCHEHQGFRTLWYGDIEHAEKEWQRIVDNHPINFVDEFTHNKNNAFKRCPYCQEIPALSYDNEHKRYKVRCMNCDEINTLWKSNYEEAKDAWNLLITALEINHVPYHNKDDEPVISILGAHRANDPDVIKNCPICGQSPIYRNGKTVDGQYRYMIHCKCNTEEIKLKTEWYSEPQNAYDEWNSLCDKQEEKIHDDLVDFLKE